MGSGCRIPSIRGLCWACLVMLQCLDVTLGVVLYSTRRDDPLESEAMNRLSQVFGMEKPPIKFHHRAPPQYMVELFNSITDDSGITKTKGPFDADVVRGFPDRARRQQMHFYYNVSYIKNTEKILEAEFHLFKMRPRHSDQMWKNLSLKDRRSLHIIEIRIYQVKDPYNMYPPQGLKLLDSRRIGTHSHGWEVFSVKPAIDDWVNDSSTNYGFLVTATTLSGFPVNGTLVRFAQRFEHHDSKQPVLVAFTDDGRRTQHRNYINPADNDFVRLDYEYRTKDPNRHRNMYNHQYAHRIKMLNERYRTEYEQRLRELQEQPQAAPRDQTHSRSRSKRSADYYKFRRHRKQVCARQEMYVDFEKIGWSGWIISPKGYNAYHCKGECPFPLGQNQKPTNHATVQSIVHALRIGTDITTPCCVPNKLYSISLLYFDDDENVILKQYDEMVAASCGCH
ncbi:bone morphogenetic protein 7-like [Lineus longissimus]|uniref:bone morphogenetic protein 7-like n=1 Tax=Lineus longissimus TaxID=88925 RepID=UPI002B4C31A0